MEYYHDIIAQQSLQYLQELRRDFDFILIGGWAVFLYTQALKSKDIDIIVEYSELGKMKQKYQVIKNERLKKYEIKTGQFDIDIYLPDYSDLGIEINEIKKNTVSRQGFNVPQLEILFLLKLYTWSQRRGSVKGRKDELDIFSLVMLSEFSWPRYLELIEKFQFEKIHQVFVSLLKETRAIPEFNINEQKIARIRKKIFKEIDPDGK